MEFFSLNQLPLYTDDFYWRMLSDNSGEAIVIHNPQNALIESPVFLKSRKTLSEHINFICENEIKRAIIVAEDISFLSKCQSLECLMIYPAHCTEKFDYSPLYNLKNIKWLQCETIYGKHEDQIAFIDYSNFPYLERLLVSGKHGHLNVDQAQNVSCLRFYAFPGSSNIKGVFPGKSVIDFSITLSSVKSLDGIESATQLRKLILTYNRSLKDISALANLKESLNFLEIDGCGKIKDFSVLQELSNLECLILKGNNEIKDLVFLNEMHRLKYLHLTMNVLNGDLSYCKSIPCVEIKDRKHYSCKNSDLPKLEIEIDSKQW